MLITLDGSLLWTIQTMYFRSEPGSNCQQRVKPVLVMILTGTIFMLSQAMEGDMHAEKRWNAHSGLERSSCPKWL